MPQRGLAAGHAALASTPRESTIVPAGRGQEWVSVAVGERVELAVAAAANFIGAWYLADLVLCDDLIRLFRDSPDKVQGAVYARGGATKVLDPEIKDSVELAVSPRSDEPAVRNYLAALQQVVDRYIAAYPACNRYSPWSIVEDMPLQHYRRGGGFKTFHTERSGAASPGSARHLVFMTYLNDVRDGGQTEFLQQRLLVPARKGLTLIWPADWTHTHRGIVSESEEKYIITGWFSFTT